MIRYYSFENEGFIEKKEWRPHYWINVEKPDAMDIRLLENLGVPESFLQNVSDVEERPRFEREDGWLLTIVRIPLNDCNNELNYTTIPIGIMTKNDIIITVCHDATEMIPDFIDHSRKRKIRIGSQPDFVLRIIYSATYWFLLYLQNINHIITEYSKHLANGVSNRVLLHMMQLQKALVYFNTSLQGNSMLTDRLNKVFVEDCDPDLMEDVEIELSQALNTVNIYMEILENSMDTFASLISNNLNNVMKTMTSISLILMIPTLIASFYGMNVGVWFGNMPNAFLLIILISFAMSVAAWYVLHRKKWL
ncbi:MAG: magnesium transporter CorA family protein [Candidatus Amulumruptor caecigallinarius]|nr:magnesium transporter CorA family protein [Candidatus Amulumruptor caecigallinarius]